MMADKKSQPKVIYVMGTGRSGSTMLQILLANSREAVGAGELTHFPSDCLNADELCSCGESYSKCAFWTLIIDGVQCDSKTMTAVSVAGALYDGHKGFVRGVVGSRSRESASLYSDWTIELLSKISSVARRPTVIDSSKYTGRALFLNKCLGDSFKVIWLYRQPRGLIRSFRCGLQDKRKSSIWILLYVTGVIFMASRVEKQIGQRCLRVSFDDLLCDPAKNIHKISEWSGLTLTGSLERIQARRSFDVGHLVSGNRLRCAGPVVFERLVDESSNSLGLADSIVELFLSAWYKLFRLS